MPYQARPILQCGLFSCGRGARSRTWSYALSGRHTDRHAPPRFPRGGRADRTRAGLSPGPRVSNPVPCLSASPPTSLSCPWQESNLHVLSGHAILSRACLPVPPQGLCSDRCPSRIRTSIARFRVWCPASWTNGHCVGAPGPGLEPGSAESKSAVLPNAPTGTVEPLPGFEPGPPVYETGARPVELKRRCCCHIVGCPRVERGVS